AFLDRPEVQASLLAAERSPAREELGPYLTFVLDRLPPGWDQPRTQPCPPYQGIGRIDIELLSTTDRDAAALTLRERLGASARGARSWADFAPCWVRRGAGGTVAWGRKPALGRRGELTLHTFPGSHQTTPSGGRPAPPRKPWWKFW